MSSKSDHPGHISVKKRERRIGGPGPIYVSLGWHSVPEQQLKSSVTVTQGQHRASLMPLGNYFNTRTICLCHISNNLFITVPRCNPFIETLMHQK